MSDEPNDVFDVDRVKSLVELMIEHGLSEVDLRQHGQTIRLRRGGEALFAMDVSSRNSPRLKWIIDSSDADFLDLGQTWSVPVIAEFDL